MLDHRERILAAIEAGDRRPAKTIVGKRHRELAFPRAARRNVGRVPWRIESVEVKIVAKRILRGIVANGAGSCAGIGVAQTIIGPANECGREGVLRNVEKNARPRKTENNRPADMIIPSCRKGRNFTSKGVPNKPTSTAKLYPMRIQSSLVGKIPAKRLDRLTRPLGYWA